MGVFRAFGREGVFRGPFLSIAKERGKERQQEPRFLHLLARYALCKIADVYRTFAQNFLFSFCYRIVSATAPLPLMPTPNNAVVSAVAAHERQRRRKEVNASYVAITTVFREREVKGSNYEKGIACADS